MTARFLTVLFLGFLWLPVAAGADDRPRFEARLSDGTRIEGDRLSDWDTAAGRPKLDGTPLLDDDNPMRWLRDRAHSPPALPVAYVETVCGDRLPGEVVGFQTAADMPLASQPDCFLVRPSESLRLRVTSDDVQIRVVASHVRRIVFQRREGEQFEPGTAFFRDGRMAKFRAARFAGASVNLLLEDGPQRAAFAELAEIHLPVADYWGHYFDELAVLCPDGRSRLLQIETTAGLIVTSSLARLAVDVRGNPQDFTRWVHGVQPAWSLDVLWIYNGDIWLRRSFAPHEVPLPRVPPGETRQQSLLSGAGFTPRVGRNVAGGPLRNGGNDYGGGFGVHASCRLSFALPDSARAFRSSIGIDTASGVGGCVRARIFVNLPEGKPLFESEFLVGSEQTADTGLVPLERDGAPAESLILEIDPAHEGRPAGADPFDIRDAADWLDPLLLLDETRIGEEIAARATRQIAAWNDWTLRSAGPGALQVQSYWDEFVPDDGAFLVGSVAVDEPFSLSRRFTLGPTDNWLVLMAARHTGGNPAPQLEIRIDGEPAGQHTVPLRENGQAAAAPITVSLEPFHAPAAGRREVEIEVRQLPGRPESPVFWTALRLTEHLPTLYQLFEDRGTFAPLDGEGRAELEQNDVHSGAAALKATAPGRFRRTFEQPIAIRRDPQWGEYRYLRFAFRKFGAGRVSIELEHDRSPERPVRYDAGLGDPCQGEARRVWVQRLPSEWIVITRDLAGECGQFDVTGLVLGVPDGEYALFDHIYLGRTPDDLEQVPATMAAEEANDRARREAARPLIDAVRESMVAIDFGDGRTGSGALVSADGWVLTTGHLAVAPQRQATVHLADGRQLKAVTRGIARDNDLSMLKIENAERLPHLPLSEEETLPTDALYVAGFHPSAGPADVAKLEVVQIYQVFRGAVRMKLVADDADTGGPLVDQHGRLLGILQRHSKFGGCLFARIEQDHPALPRLRDGQVWGRWQPGTGPVVGITGAATKDGLRVEQVAPHSPATRAGLEPGDVVQKFDGHSIVSHNDIDRHVAEKNAGDRATLEVLRDGKQQEIQVELGPRLP